MNKLSVKTTAGELIFGWGYMLLQLFVLPQVLHILNGLLLRPLPSASLNFVFFGLNFICTTVIFRRFLKKSAMLTVKNLIRLFRSVTYGLVVYWVLSYVVAVLILTVYPSFHNVNDATIGTIAKDNYVLVTLGTVLLVPVTEELLFRGLLFQGLYHKNHILAYIVSTVAFCLPHVISYVGKYEPLHLLMCFIQYIPAGVCLAWTYAKADSIYAPILMHVLINLVGMLAMR